MIQRITKRRYWGSPNDRCTTDSDLLIVAVQACRHIFSTVWFNLSGSLGQKNTWHAI